jgi:hypothetical protein
MANKSKKEQQNIEKLRPQKEQQITPATATQRPKKMQQQNKSQINNPKSPTNIKLTTQTYNTI